MSQVKILCRDISQDASGCHHCCLTAKPFNHKTHPIGCLAPPEKNFRGDYKI